ncbi:MAG: pyridoxal-phosphate dependent enzyme [Holophagae bacterium]|jgi:threonine dehydratase
MNGDPTFDDVLAAADRIAGRVHRTPVVTSSAIDGIAGASLHFKCENLQKVGAFKARGASNAVLALDDEAADRGVATHSSGNHAAALAFAAAQRGIAAHVVMPSSAPPVKKAAVAGYGAEITECEPTLAARESTLEQVVSKTGATFIHAYDNPMVIAGQGTASLELIADVPDLEIIMAPVGGGGLMSGTALAMSASRPDVSLWGAEPAGADDAFRSLRDGRIHPSIKPKTIADGLLTSLSERTFRMLNARLEGILTVSEDSIMRAMRLLWERAKLVVEPSGAVPLAAVLEHPDHFEGRRVGLIISGGNVDLDHVPW